MEMAKTTQQFSANREPAKTHLPKNYQRKDIVDRGGQFRPGTTTYLWRRFFFQRIGWERNLGMIGLTAITDEYANQGKGTEYPR